MSMYGGNSNYPAGVTDNDPHFNSDPDGNEHEYRERRSVRYGLKLRGIVFTDEELTEIVWAIHNYTRPFQTAKEIRAQGSAADKIDAESRKRAALK